MGSMCPSPKVNAARCPQKPRWHSPVHKLSLYTDLTIFSSFFFTAASEDPSLIPSPQEYPSSTLSVDSYLDLMVKFKCCSSLPIGR